MTRRGVLNAVLAVAVIGSGVAVWATVGASASTKSTPATLEATNGTVLSTVSASGTVAAGQQVDVGFTTGGTVTEIDVQNGDHVTAGQVLAKVDPTTAQSSLDLAQAQLASAQAQLATAEDATSTSGATSPASSATPTASGGQQQAQNAYDAATQQVDRDVAFAHACTTDPATPPANGLNCTTVNDQLAVDLGAQQSAQSQLTVAFAASAAEATTSTRSSGASTSSSGAAGSSTSIPQAQASVLSAQNQVASAQKALDGTTLVAPVDGTVSGLTAQVGATVGAGNTSGSTTVASTSGASTASTSGGSSGAGGAAAGSSSASSGQSSTSSGSAGSGSTILVVTDLDSLDVQASFTEADAVKVKAHQKVLVTFSALPNVTVQGSVTEIATTATSSNGVVGVAVVVGLDKVPDGLRPGMTANAQVVVDEADGVLLVPSAAINGSGNTSTVTVVGSDGKEVTRTVTVGLRGDSSVEITSGLQQGDKIVRTTTTASTSAAGTSGSTNSGSGSGTLGGTLTGGGATGGGPAGGGLSGRRGGGG